MTCEKRATRVRETSRHSVVTRSRQITHVTLRQTSKRIVPSISCDSPLQVRSTPCVELPHDRDTLSPVRECATAILCAPSYSRVPGRRM